MRPTAPAIHYRVLPCSLGLACVAVREGLVCAIQLGDDASTLAESLASRFPHAEIEQAGPEDEPLIGLVSAALNSGAGLEALPLAVDGTPFQRRVWDYLRTIPAGETRSYTQVADAIGRPTAVRAVAAACASNRIAVAIPCHRVVRSDGTLSGFRWGIERKRVLLAREQVADT